MKSLRAEIGLASLWIAVCTLLSLLLQRQVMEPTANLVQYLPLMFHSHDPTLYPGDDYVQLLVERTPNWFWWFLGKALPTVNPYPHLLALNILSRLAGGGLIYWIARKLTGDWRAGLIAVFLLSGQADTVLGRGDINWAYFTHTAASVPLLLLSLGLLLNGRTALAFFIAGVTWNVHVLNAAYFSLFLLFWLFFRRETLSGKNVLRCAIAAIVPALPVLPRLFSGALGGGVDEVWWVHALAYYNRLLSPFQQPLSDWVRFGGYLFLSLLFIRRQPKGRARAIGKAMLAMWGVLYGLGALGVELYPLPFFFKLQPFRCTDVFILWFFVEFAKNQREGLASKDLTVRVLYFGLLLLLYFFNLKARPNEVKLVFTLLWIVLALLSGWSQWRPQDRSNKSLGPVFRALAWGSTTYAMALMAISIPWVFNASDALIVFVQQRHLLWSTWICFVAGAWLVLRLMPARPVDTRLVRVTTALLLVLLAAEWIQRTADFSIRRSRAMHHWLFDHYHPDFFDAAYWCRVYTPKDALFIVPPYRGGFRAESHRSVFASWDEQLTFMIAPDYVKEYDRRLRLLQFDPWATPDSHRDWRPAPEQLLKIQREFGAGYVVIERDKSLPFSLLYRNGQYSVYRLD